MILYQPWYPRAGCRTMDNAAFFSSRNQRARRRALRVCEDCPVQEECLDFALQFDDSRDFGVWGGTTREQRIRIRALRRLQVVAV
jgi:WhiB family redox-sensing transcriptional regulator